VPEMKPSPGLTASNYNTILTNNTPQQLAELAPFLDLTLKLGPNK
jgi:hypothetical protein